MDVALSKTSMLSLNGEQGTPEFDYCWVAQLQWVARLYSDPDSQNARMELADTSLND